MNKKLKDNRGYTLDAEARTKEKQAEIYDYRQAHAKKRLPFWGGAVRLDDCLYDENGNEKENSLLSDCGKGAEAIRRCGEPDPADNTAWLGEFYASIATLDSIEQKVVAALLKDMRPQVAARIAGTNRMRVYRTMEKLRKLLATAHSLWLRRWE